jgi:hypothetical protein
MVCKSRTQSVALRHDMVLGALGCIACRAGVATVVEPAIECLRLALGHISWEQGDVLAVMPDSGLVVADISVVHPAAQTYVVREAGKTGAAVSSCEEEKRSICGDGGSIFGGSFVPLTMESWWQLGLLAVRFHVPPRRAPKSLVSARSDVTMAAFMSGALQGMGVALAPGNNVVSREMLHVYAAACGSVACTGAFVRLLMLSRVSHLSMVCWLCPKFSFLQCSVGVAWCTLF